MCVCVCVCLCVCVLCVIPWGVTFTNLADLLQFEPSSPDVNQKLILLVSLKAECRYVTQIFKSKIPV